MSSTTRTPAARTVQVFDRNLTVCSQEPEAGTLPTEAAVILYVVKDHETC
ncbi:hypothetical protein [Streptomyces sp. Y7]